jgi:trehalose 6-phosphate synthase
VTDRDTTAGYEFVMATDWLPVRDDPPGWRNTAPAATPSLRTLVAAHEGAWIGCTARSPRHPLLLDDVWLHPVVLEHRETADYYHGHCLSTLAPLYVDCGRQPQFGPPWREAYRRVNHRIADATSKIATPGATVWVHDYHLQLVPGYLRQARPDLTIGFFLHSTFPPVERFIQQPMRAQILAGLLGADLIGFQQAQSATNFLDVAVELGLRHDGQIVQTGDRQVAARVFPTSVDTACTDALATNPRVRARADAIRTTVGNPNLILLSIGSPDHADGVLRRLDAYAQLLAEGQLDPLDTVLIHVATGDDEDLAVHHHERDRIERQVAQINGMYARPGRPVVHYVRHEPDPSDLVALYVASDVMLALPLRQGMTLSAKDFVAARTDNTGRLVLSEFTGAAADLPEADIVNPHDTDAVKHAILTAATTCQTPSEPMHTMRRRLHLRNAQAWANDFLTALASSARHGRPDLAVETRP